MSEITTHSVDPASAEAAALLRAMVAEIDALYNDRPGSVHSVSADPEEMTPPTGDFLALARDGRLIGCGGIKRLDSQACEVKRMYVLPAARGQGLSRVLLDALEQRARALGYSVARLDTADRQPAAERLYEGSGYRRIPPYNDNDLATYWYEKDLR